MACEKLFEVDTVLTADTVEWCPRDGLHQVLAAGTYQLDEETGVRRGALALYEWNHSRYLVRMRKNDAEITIGSCSLMQVLHSETKKITNGILDMKW